MTTHPQSQPSIVERLRARAEYHAAYDGDLMIEAAERIEGLERELEFYKGMAQ